MAKLNIKKILRSKSIEDLKEMLVIEKDYLKQAMESVCELEEIILESRLSQSSTIGGLRPIASGYCLNCLMLKMQRVSM